MPSFKNVDKRHLHFVRVIVGTRRYRAIAIMILVTRPCCVDTAYDQCFEFELEYVVIRYVYKFRVRRVRFVVAILLHKSHCYRLASVESACVTQKRQ